MIHRKLLVCAFAVFSFFSLASPAPAEGFVDLAIGGAFTDGSLIGAGPTVPLDDSVTGGVRGGYWFEGIPFVDFGLALQVTVFSPLDQAIVGGLNLRVISVPITPMVMARVPLFKSDRLEHGFRVTEERP